MTTMGDLSAMPSQRCGGDMGRMTGLRCRTSPRRNYAGSAREKKGRCGTAGVEFLGWTVAHRTRHIASSKNKTACRAEGGELATRKSPPNAKNSALRPALGGASVSNWQRVQRPPFARDATLGAICAPTWGQNQRRQEEKRIIPTFSQAKNKQRKRLNVRSELDGSNRPFHPGRGQDCVGGARGCAE